MFLVFLKQAFRNIFRNRTYSLLNILGLSASLTCFAFIALWVHDELSFDKFNKKYSQIYRLTGIEKTETGTRKSAVTSAPMASALKNDYPEIKQTVRLALREEIVEHKGQQILQSNILVADPTFFEIFSYELSKGDIQTALNDPFSIILTESTAKKYFGDNNPIGESLKMFMYDSSNSGALYKVTGVMPDPPQNAHFTFTMVASFKTVEVVNPDILTLDGWGDGSFYTYLLLREGVDHKSFSNKISKFYKKYVGELAVVWSNIYTYTLQPLADIYLRSNLEYEIAETGNINNVYIFSTIGLLILLLAGINYVNLSTARSINRAKEVSIKKVVGANKRQLIYQYLTESVVTAFIALWISFIFSYLLKTFFFAITGKELSLFASPVLILFLVLMTVLLGLLSGIYPALVLSSFKPTTTLKGAFKSSSGGIFFRKTLVVSQFVITMVLITGIVIIYSQMSFIKHKDLGFDKDALVFIRVNGNTDVINGYNAFKNELENNPLISGAATSNSMIIGGVGSGGAETVDMNGKPLQVNTSRLRIDNKYLDVYGIKLIAGNNFKENASTDTLRQVVLNEIAVKKFGWKDAQAAIGKPFRMGSQQGIIIGVTKDFHFNSLQESISPLAIYPVDQRFSRISLKVEKSKAHEALAFIEKTWKKYFPSALFDFGFVNQQLQRQYEAEERFSKIFLYFSILSLLIACLGLYGLITYTIVQRTKEIGIRKILGATANGIAAMLSGDFIKLVFLACIISIPLAWYFMNKWLQDFAYRVELSWWMFFVAGSFVIMIALISVSLKSIQAAVSNPINSLRTE